MNIRLPDYDNSVLSVAASVLRHYGAYCGHKGLPLIDKLLLKGYKNIVVMLFDAMGASIIEKLLDKDGFFRSNTVQNISSVFPPTTTAATTAIESGLSPAEHGWLGWSLYFEELDKNVSIFPNTISGADGVPAADYSVVNRYLPVKRVFEKIKEATGGETEAIYISPFSSHKVESVNDICAEVKKISSQQGRKYIYTYWHRPDYDMHIEGIESEAAKNCVREIESVVSEMCKRLQNTLVIITSDHGMTDIENKNLSDYPFIWNSLVRPPSMESRAMSMFVKEGLETSFKEAFNDAFGEDYILMSKEDVFARKIFGPGESHPRTEGFIGDFLAIATGKTNIIAPSAAEKPLLKASHAGLTEDEMTVPLIIIER